MYRHSISFSICCCPVVLRMLSRCVLHHSNTKHAGGGGVPPGEVGVCNLGKTNLYFFLHRPNIARPTPSTPQLSCSFFLSLLRTVHPAWGDLKPVVHAIKYHTQLAETSLDKTLDYTAVGFKFFKSHEILRKNCIVAFVILIHHELYKPGYTGTGWHRHVFSKKISGTSSYRVD